MLAGELLAERFELIEEVQRGGMGTIFRARDRASGQTVAVKVLRKANAEDLARFAQEAKVLEELSRPIPGIVAHVAHDVSEAGPSYLAMAWLEGHDLRQRLWQRALDVGETVALGGRLATTLGAIHERGLVHRDMKPSNIFLVGGHAEEAVLIDFGVVLRDQGHAAETRSGFLVGTPAYMAPEQVRGQTKVDARADLFGLGCILYACLAAKPPFGGESHVAVLTKILLEQPVPIDEVRFDVPPKLASLIHQLLAKDPEDRPPNARAVFEALTAVDVGARSQRSGATSPPVLGIVEQRFLTLILAKAPEGEGLPKVGHELSALATASGAEIARLVDGSLVAWIEQGAATEQASQAAELALQLRRVTASAGFAIATARGVVAERLPVGQVIDRAASLAGGAAPGEVLVDGVTAGLLDDRFEVLPGEAALVLVGVRDWSPGRRTLLGKPTQCVGRDRELHTLEALFREAVEEPAARAVLVVGEAGIGKTRIRSEVVRRLRDASAEVEIWTARGDPLSAGSPFGLIRRALRSAIGAREGDDVAAQSLRLASFIARHVAPDDLEHVGEFVGEIVGVTLVSTPSARLLAARSNAVLMGDQLRRAFESLIVAECKHHPLVLVLEDLHWGDLPTVRLVAAALRAAAELPFFVLALARPEVHDRFPRLWEDSGLSTVHVAGLGRRAAAALVRGALGEDVDDALVERLVERAGGHAFTLEELVRAAASGKADDALPETVLAMMQRRVDEIPPDGRRLLRAASVFGAAFWTGGLAELVGQPNDAALASSLEGLAAQELVSRRSTSRFRGEAEWTFRHALLREAVHGTLTDADRALGHRLAGTWLVRAGERDAVTIAEHFERGQDPSRAAEWYLRASERALAGNDWHEAIGCAERGLPLALDADTEVRGELHLAVAQACAWSGDVRRAEREAIEAAARLPRGSGAWFDAVAEVVTAAGMGLGHVDLAREWVDAMLAAWAELDDVQAAVIAAARAVTPMLLAGERERAHALLVRIEAMALAGMPLAEAHLARARASSAFRGDKDLGAYVEFTRAGIERLEAAGDERTLAQQCTNLGYALTLLGAPEAEQVLEEGIRESERLGLPLQAGTHRQNLGLVLARQGRLTEALALERASIDTFRGAGDKRFEAASHVYLSTILEMARDFEGAESAARVALDMAAAYPSRRATALGAMAAARLGRGEALEALEAAREGMALLATIGALEEGEEKLRFVYSAALEANGHADEAARELAIARERLEERAARIRDPGWRKSFLENVPENVALLGGPPEGGCQRGAEPCRT